MIKEGKIKVVLNKNIHQYDKKEQKLKVQEKRNLLSIIFKKGYKELWQEQNVLLDKQKSRIQRKNKEVKKLKTKIEELETEISDLKARRAKKKSK